MIGRIVSASQKSSTFKPLVMCSFPWDDIALCQGTGSNEENMDFRSHSSPHEQSIKLFEMVCTHAFSQLCAWNSFSISVWQNPVHLSRPRLNVTSSVKPVSIFSNRINLSICCTLKHLDYPLKIVLMFFKELFLLCWILKS